MHNGMVRSVTDNDDVMMMIMYLQQILPLIQCMIYFIEHYNSQILSCLKLNPNKGPSYLLEYNLIRVYSVCHLNVQWCTNADDE